ncbi:phosphatase PAP2 family protein [Geminocystis sp. NIES-3709]|uniref:phosphatase PAP2 family protein n=1 Tax=Geminocystis sp. NIES-3709 TaxID=1617448 RepID=UPI0005FCA80F|nr:phosphatase PAP2 family protein [Geminocystis sp. NIES-3709]BAQ65734.1 membrane-associated phospholipid phosphatase [Geminocystis sp. NIES-3709]
MPSLPLDKYFKNSYQKLKHNFSIIIFSFLLPLIVFTILTLNVIFLKNSTFSWDISILLTIHNISQKFWDEFVPILTNFGGFKFILFFLTPIIVLFLSQIKRRLLIYLIVSIFSSAIVNFIIKILIHRSRPHLWESSYSFPSDYSFPSGHAMGSITLALTLLIIFWGSRWTIFFVILAGIYVISIGWTRLYLGVHFPSDILGGWLLGIAWTSLITLLLNPRQSEKNTN